MKNPYASQLGDRNAIEVISATPGRVSELANTLGPARVNEAPAQGKWSVREIVCHLADCEIVFAYRLRQALAQDRHAIQPFDQDQFAKQYGEKDLASALGTFSAVRHWNTQLIRGLTPQQLSKQVTHPERGDMTVQTIVETMGSQDLNHLAHIDAIARTRATA